jgi:hypothetical protein
LEARFPSNGTLSGSSFFLGFLNSAITQPLLGEPNDGSAARIDVLFDGTVNLMPGTPATSITLVPEPSSFALLALGAIGICLHRKRRLN